MAALVADGVAASRLTAIGFGMENPVADDKTEAGRAQNRRVIAHAQTLRSRQRLARLLIAELMGKARGLLYSSAKAINNT